jgi:hypothetical protein
MARAKRHYLPGQVWHITHRCHQREFLLKFATDRRRWIKIFLEATKRYGLVVLNYMVGCGTSFTLFNWSRFARRISRQMAEPHTAQLSGRLSHRKLPKRPASGASASPNSSPCPILDPRKHPSNCQPTSSMDVPSFHYRDGRLPRLPLISGANRLPRHPRCHLCRN